MTDLRIVTPPTAEPVSLAEALAHLRLEAGTEDALVGSLITAAREAAENYTGRAWTDAVYELRVDAFQSVIDLPIAPVRDLRPVAYRNAAGEVVGFSGTAMLLDHPYAPAVVLHGAWPVTDGLPGAVQLRFQGGYSTTGLRVPRVVVQAILLMVGHLYTNREDVVTAQTYKLARGFESLLQSYRRNYGS